MEGRTVSIGKLQRGLSDWLNRAAYRNERIVVTSHNRPKAAVISIEDLCLLEELEEAQAVREGLEEYRAGKMISLADLEAELGLE